MTTRRLIGLLSIPVLLLGIPCQAENLVTTFTGSGPDTTPRFAVEGPWRIDWQVASDQPLLATFYSNLYEAESSRYVGFITQLRGTGSGSKLIRESGDFRIGISGYNAEWTLRIVELTEDDAAAMTPAGREAPADTPARRTPPEPSNLVASGSFIGWNAPDDAMLELVAGDGGLVQVVTFVDGACPGLTESTTVLFVTPETGATNVYDSILLDDGSRCYFDEVVPRFR